MQVHEACNKYPASTGEQQDTEADVTQLRLGQERSLHQCQNYLSIQQSFKLCLRINHSLGDVVVGCIHAHQTREAARPLAPKAAKSLRFTPQILGKDIILKLVNISLQQYIIRMEVIPIMPSKKLEAQQAEYIGKNKTQLLKQLR